MNDNTLSIKTKICTARFDDTVQFFARVFDMLAVEAWDNPGDRGAILALPGGHREALVEVWQDDGEHDFDGVSLQVRVADVDAFAASLPKCIEREGPKDRPWGSRYLYMKDPNGIQVIAYSDGT